MSLPAQLPTARDPEAHRAPALRWGIVGPGWIAQRFATSLHQHSQQWVAAVCGSSLPRAEDFARRFAIPKACSDLSQLLNDDNIDVIYVATPHPSHFAIALAAIEAGKPVLVEKPLALNASQVSTLQQAARSQQVMLMEGMWNWFIPKFDVLEQLLTFGAVGEIHTIIADHGEYFTDDHRIFNPDLAGGTLMDLGSYNLSLATHLAGPAQEVIACGQPAHSGVNGQASIILRHAGGTQSSLHTTLFSHTPCQAVIAGSEGSIYFDTKFYAPGNFHLVDRHNRRLSYLAPDAGYDHLWYQAVHMAHCIGEGRTDSPRHSLDQVRISMQAMDNVRQQLGIEFRGEYDHQ